MLIFWYKKMHYWPEHCGQALVRYLITAMNNLMCAYRKTYSFKYVLLIIRRNQAKQNANESLTVTVTVLSGTWKWHTTPINS